MIRDNFSKRHNILLLMVKLLKHAVWSHPSALRKIWVHQNNQIPQPQKEISSTVISQHPKDNTSRLIWFLSAQFPSGHIKIDFNVHLFHLRWFTIFQVIRLGLKWPFTQNINDIFKLLIYLQKSQFNIYNNSLMINYLICKS